MKPAEEPVLVVDAGNRVVGTATRGEMRARGLVHRVTYVFVHDGRSRIFVHLRTATKDVYPAHHDAAAGGVLAPGESYEESARRELAEELGVRDRPLRAWTDAYFEDGSTRCWGRVFTCRHEGPFRFQPEEVQDGRFVPLARALAAEPAPMTPDTLAALRGLVQHHPEALAPGPEGM